MGLDTPILMIVFNRPDKTQQVIKALEAVQPQRIFVAADGPRKDLSADAADCNEVRDLFEHLRWPCEVIKLYRPENLGVHFNPRFALKWFFEQVEEGIILEDDCVPGEDFFYYCKALLEKYRHNESIFTINGGNLGFQLNNGYSYTFSRFMNMTGWATWRRSEQAVDYDLNTWRQVKKPTWFLYKYLRQNIFDFDINWYRYWAYRFNLTITQREIKWWDYQWIYHQLTHKKFSIVPGKNLVTNIGFDGSASNLSDPGNPAANIPIAQLDFPLLHPPNLAVDLQYEEDFVKWVWCYHKRLPVLFYIKSFISKLLKR